MYAVEAPFVENKEQDDNAGGHANRQTHYIDGRKGFALPHVAQGNLQVISDHKQERGVLVMGKPVSGFSITAEFGIFPYRFCTNLLMN
jgi:hypothetical protein